MAKVNLVIANCTKALLDLNLIEMIPDLRPVTELLDSDGRQFMQLVGAAELDPGSLMVGSPYYALLCVLL